MSEKYTLITGACGGLGRSFVKLCAKNGENLLLLGTNKMKLEYFIKENDNILKDVSVKYFECNLAKVGDRFEVVKFIENNDIVVNKLINNAGVIIEGDLEKFYDEEIANAIEVNCVGTLDLTKKILKIRDVTQKMEVLTVSSVAGFYPIPHMAVYSATKSFLINMMTALSFEYKGKNVVFTTVCPGGMATTKEMRDSIKSMGLGGKLSTLDTDKVAKISLKALRQKKKIVTPGFFNKILVFFSKIFPRTFLSKSAGKVYYKSKKKRGL